MIEKGKIYNINNMYGECLEIDEDGGLFEIKSSRIWVQKSDIGKEVKE